MKEKSCVVCGSNSEQGLHILGSVICPQCERRIMLTDANDAQYSRFVGKLLGIAKQVARMN